MFDAIFARLNQRADNMGQMMQRLGLELTTPSADSGGWVFQAAARSCSACRSADRCSLWLQAHPGEIEAAPPFCPNAVRFQRMRGHA